MLDLNADEPPRQNFDLDELSARLAQCAAAWVPQCYPQGRIADGELRLADITGRPPRKQGSCVIPLRGDHAGEWHDFGDNTGGGPLSTLSNATGLHGRELFERAAEITGYTNGHDKSGNVKSVPKQADTIGTGEVPALHSKSDGTSEKTTPRDPSKEIEFIISRAHPIAGTLAEKYLISRGLYNPQCSDLLFNPDVTDWKAKIGRPAMIGVVRSATGECMGIHRTYLNEDGTGKAEMAGSSRKMLGEIRGGAVRLASIGTDGRLGIAEGIETALAAALLYDIPTWAALSTSGMREFEIPGAITKLYLFADAGKAGIDAAAALQARAQQLSLATVLAIPLSGDDFATDLAQGKRVELETPLRPQTEPHAPAQANGLWSAPAVPVLDPDNPMDTAHQLVAALYTREGRSTLIHNNGDFFGYAGTHYPMLDEGDVRARVWKWLEGCQAYRSKKLSAFKPTSATVSGAMDALRAAINLPADVTAPAWLEDAGQPEPAEIASCTNGLLHIPSLTLIPHTPLFFSHNALEFAYQPTAPPASEWQRFLTSIWDEDQESIDTLQDIFGYCLTGDTRQQKAFLMVGPKRSGKGTIARVLTALLGKHNVVGVRLSSLESDFKGWEPLIGKRVAVISDARLSGKIDQQAISECLLAVSGEDTVTIDRKYKSTWTGRLQTRFVLLSNELPRIVDASGALANRFIVLMMTKTFIGHEDIELTTKLMRELPGILNWAIEGYRRLRARGHFIMPAASTEAVAELFELGSPISAFIAECCLVDAGQNVSGEDLFKVWTMWCKKNGRDHSGTAQSFGRDLRAAAPEVGLVEMPAEGPRERRYHGIGLRWEWQSKLRPTDFNQ